MGNEASAPAKKVATTVLRKAGDNMNTLGYPAVHERVFLPPTGKPHRYTICRCWMSLKFPLCDNTHQRLQKAGCQVGPVMLEVKAPQNVGAEYFGPGADGPSNLGGSSLRSFMAGGTLAASLAGGAYASGFV